MYNKFRMHSAPVHFANFFDELLNNDFTASDYRSPLNASVNIKELDDKYELHLVAPGLKKEDFQISVDKNLLTVSFEQKENTEQSKDKWIRQEFKMKSFKRSFSLNEKIDAASISAVYEGGVLTLSLPKKEKEELKPMAISVQ
ncbi:MAG: Hsp20/alpha crystallin family protein [Chitinophagaceae bacterium]